MTNDGTWTYAWQKGRQLASMAKAGTSASFVYNADGLRIQKTVNGAVTNYILHGKNIVHLSRGSDALHFWYDAQNRPAIIEFNGVKYAYIHNLQGDVVGLRDAAGNEVVRYTYDAWGKMLSTTGSLASTLGYMNPFRYRGYVYDEETGLYYLRSRYYNPTWERFVNADVLIGGLGSLVMHNIYAYCKNTVTAATDSNGCDAIYITDPSGFSHSSLLLEDSKGQWYYFYWGANTSGMDESEGSSAVAGSAGGGTVTVKFDVLKGVEINKNDKTASLKSINTALKDEDLNKNLLYGSNYQHMVLLKGDFTLSIDHAQKYNKDQAKMVYSAFLGNCAQMSLDVLGASLNFVEQCALKEISDDIVPTQIHSGLELFEAIREFFM